MAPESSTAEREADRFAEAFVSTPFSHDPRHQRRIDMVADYERSGTPPPLPERIPVPDPSGDLDTDEIIATR